MSRFGLVAAIATVGLSCSISVWGQSPQNFVSVMPCRVADTRNPAGAFGSYMTAGSTRSFPIPSGTCGIPTNAAAYSLNVTVVPKGPLDFLTMWPTGQQQPNVSTLNSPSGQIVANAAIIPAGTNGAVDVYVTNSTDVILDINGYFLPQTPQAINTVIGSGSLSSNTTGSADTAIGFRALCLNTEGSNNTATGASALQSNTSGHFNNAFGASALGSNVTGSNNSAFGGEALKGNLTGSNNTAIGSGALTISQTAIGNTAIGALALLNSIGSFNTALGSSALFQNTGGSNNIGIGVNGGVNLTNGSFNIEIGNQGTSIDSNVIRIGDNSNQTRTFIAGISNALGTGSVVLIDPNGQLGIVPSSERYKEDIHDMAGTSDALMQLRPVTFRYKQATNGGNKPLQYGLIGEEVAKVYPELVVYGKDGQVESVQYHQFPALLLNEWQKQQRAIKQQQEQIQQQKQLMHSLESRIAALEGLLHDQVPAVSSSPSENRH